MSESTPSIIDTFPLSEPQRAAATARGRDVVVTAGAGTGKTRTLVARYLSLLHDGVPLRQIVAITFTRKAAREMRNRVREEINLYLRQPHLDPVTSQIWSDFYDSLDAARIDTIHTLSAEILRTHPAELAIDPRFIVLDEAQIALFLQESVEATLAQAVQQPYLRPLFAILGERDFQQSMIRLLKKRLDVAESMANVSAKSILTHWRKTLENRQDLVLERLWADPDFLAARKVLLTNQAAVLDDKIEVQRRLVLKALEFDTVESTGERIRNLAVLDEIRVNAGSQKNWPMGKGQLDEVKEALKILRALWRKHPLLSMMLNAQDKALAEAMPAIYSLYQFAEQAYQDRKAEREGLDFDDLEALAIQLLAEHAEIRAYWQQQFQAMLVDEFQDTNARQRRLIRLLCPDPGNLFIVGDAKQSIYRFRGADVAVFQEERRRIVGQGGLAVDLDTSYRTHSALLMGMNGLLEPALGPDSPDLPPWIAPFAGLKAANDSPTSGLTPPFIEFHLTLGAKSEALPRAARALAGRLAELQSGSLLNFGEMAILCRATGSFHFYEDALDAAGIPYLTVSGKGFYDRPEIRDLLNALQAIADPYDDLALAGLLRSPACGLPDSTLYNLAQSNPAGLPLWERLRAEAEAAGAGELERIKNAVDLVETLNDESGRSNVADVLKRFLDLTHYRASLRRTGQSRQLRNITKLLADIHASQLVYIAEFMEYVQTLRESGSREGEARATTGGAVQIMSIHAAKGLEFPLVVLGDAGSNLVARADLVIDPELGILLPQKGSDDDRAAAYRMGNELAKEQEAAELKRLLYVALTRAEQMLMISGCASRKKNETASLKGWLLELGEVVALPDQDLGEYDESGDGKLHFDLELKQLPIVATIYEPGYAPPQTFSTPQQTDRPLDFVSRPPLVEPLTASLRDQVEDEVRQPHWQILPQTRALEPPAQAIGFLVHEALALWRFPDGTFDHWMTARIRQYGLIDQRQLSGVLGETSRLLSHFRKSPLYREINSATRRLHEVPFAYQDNGQLKTGYIDALFQNDDGWTLVDFKTDRVSTESQARQVLNKRKNLTQIRGYARAATQLVGQRPRMLLCLIDDRIGVVVQQVDAQEAL